MRRMLVARVFADTALLAAIFVGVVRLGYRLELLIPSYLLLSGFIIGVYLLIHKGKVKRPGYESQVLRFKVEFGILALSFILAFTMGRVSVLENFATPFVLIFLFLSIFLLRTYRHLDYHRSNVELGKLNLKYAAVAVMFLVVLSIGPVRTVVVNVAVNLITLIFYEIVMALAHGLVALVNLFSFTGHLTTPAGMTQRVGVRTLEKLPSSNFLLDFHIPPALTLALKIAAAAAALAILVLLIVKLFKNLYPGINRHPFVESREFITPAKTVESVSAGHRQRLKGYEGVIRDCYLKFLKLCRAAGIELKDSDTTLEINRKYAKEFDSQSVEKLRTIYIKTRYHDRQADKSAADESVNLIKKIKNESKKSFKAGG